MRGLPWLLIASLLAGCSFPDLAPPPPTPPREPEPQPLQEVRVRQVLEGLDSAMLLPDRRVVYTQEDWRVLWMLHAPVRRVVENGETRDLRRDAPVVDFSVERVVAVFGGDQLGGCARVEVAGAARAANGTTLVTVTTTPLPGPCGGHSPFAFAALPRDGSGLAFVEAAGRGEQHAPLEAPPCGTLSIRLDRDALRPRNETVNVSARFEPCDGDAPLVTPGCVTSPFDAVVDEGSLAAFLSNASGDAMQGYFCDVIRAPVPTPLPVEARWLWNGTLSRGWCSLVIGAGSDCGMRSEAVTAGAHTITVSARVGAWTFTAAREVMVLPERRLVPVLRVDETLRGAEAPADCSEGQEVEGVLHVPGGAALLVERNLTTANGTRLLRYALREGEGITLTSADGALLYRVLWSGGVALIEGEPAPTRQESRMISENREIVDARAARMLDPRWVETDPGALTCVFAPV